jgi:protocatechuate 3,4-dioxygenase beta subunit
MWLRVGLLVSVVLAVAPGAQQPAPTAPRSVAGVVRDVLTLAPIAGARVRVAAFNHEGCEPCRASPGLPNALTDSEGRFSIDDVPGTFVLEADQTGYAEGGFGVRRPTGRAARIDLAPGKRLDGLEILLFREAVFTGHVTDENGSPVQGIEVELSRIDARGRSTVPSWNSADADPARPLTDARGNYTAYVAPDEYAVAAIRGFVPAFHPSVERLQAASLVTADPGEVVSGIDVQLPPARLGRVSGRFPIPADPLAVRFAPAISLRNARFDIRGHFDGDRFVVVNVPYGDYSLEIASSRLGDRTTPGGPVLEWWARVPVRVDEAAVEVGDLQPKRSLVVTGLVKSPGTKTAADWSGTGVRLHALDDGDSCGKNPSWHPVATGGQFIINTMPGRFRLCATPQNRFGRVEATLKGVDVVDLPFAVGEDVRDIRVFQPPKPVSLRGVVHSPGGRPVREGWVVVFPADSRYWAHAVGDGARFASARVSVTGSFQIDTLVPAEYFIAAVDDPSIDGWPMESWLESAADGASRVPLGRSEMRTLSPLKLRTIPVERAPVREYRRRVDGAATPVMGTPDRFTLEGVVQDAAGHPVPHAAVTAVRTSSPEWRPRPVLTDQDGRYRLIGLGAGEYSIRAEADVPFRAEPVAIRVAGRVQPMIVTDIHEVRMTVKQNDTVNFKLEHVERSVSRPMR